MQRGVTTPWLVAGLTAAMTAGAVRYGAVLFQAPVPVVETVWHAYVAVSNDLPSIRLNLQMTVLLATPRHPARVALFPSTSVFRDLTLDGRAIVPVLQEGWYYAPIRWPGAHRIEARLDISPVIDRGDVSLALIKPETEEAVVSFEAGDALDVSVNGRSCGGPGSNGTQQVWRLAPTGGVNIVWTRSRQPVDQAGQVAVRPSIVWTLRERSLVARATLEIRRVSGRPDRADIVLPVGADNIRVSGAALREFRQDGRMLHLYGDGELEAVVTVQLDFEVPRPEGDTVMFPALGVTDGYLETGGWLLVANESQGVLLENRVDGLQPASELDVPGVVMKLATARVLFFYQTVARDGAPIFDVVTRTPFPVVDTRVDRAEVTVVMRPSGEEMTRLRYVLRNTGRKYLTLALPPGAEVLSARVNDRECRLASVGVITLLPLTRSIQTLSGLVPFSAEITYCRPARSGVRSDGWTEQVHLDLPELPDVPVAVLNVSVYGPNGRAIRAVRGGLQQVKGAESPVPDGVAQTLAYNYYRNGNDLYAANRIEEAEAALMAVTNLLPTGPIAVYAYGLISNIRAGRGAAPVKADKTDRARLALIREGLAGSNDIREKEQGALIREGLDRIAQGDAQMGVEILNAADAVGNEITRRSGSMEKQKSVRRGYEETLNEAKKEIGERERLDKRLKELQVQAGKLVKEDGEGAKARTLAGALIEASREQNLDAGEVQSATFGDWATASPVAPADVSAAARAGQYRNDVKAGKMMAGGAATAAQASTTDLGRQVAAIERAIAQAERNEPPAASLGAGDMSGIRTNVAGTNKKVDALLADLAARQNSPYRVADRQAQNEVQRLQKLNDVNRASYGQLDEVLEQEFKVLDSKLKQAEALAATAELEKRSAEQAVIDLHPTATSGWSLDAQAVDSFLGANGYFSASNVPAISHSVDVWNNRVFFSNAAGVPEAVQQVVEKLGYNQGQVVPVTARRLDIGCVPPSLDSWFDRTLTDRRRYGVLDEAQYQTLLAVTSVAVCAKGEPETRQIVVGASGTVAGEPLAVRSSEAGFNRLWMGGREIELAAEQYVVIDAGREVLVLRAGAVQNWLDVAAVLPIAVPDRPLELPLSGEPVCFEKTLLAAGESPDLVIELKGE